MGILAIGLIAILQVVVQSSVNLAMNRHRVEAVQRAESVLAEIRMLRDQGANVPDEIVSAFPAGTFTLPNGQLPEEVISISYEDPGASPLFITVKVQWLELRGRIAREELSTALEKE